MGVFNDPVGRGLQVFITSFVEGDLSLVISWISHQKLEPWRLDCWIHKIITDQNNNNNN